jgi:predicted ATPase/class 3 adenylate cyclase
LPTGTVAFLFTDIEGSTERWESHRAAMSAAVQQHDTVLQQAIQAHDGYVFKRMGDAFCAAFRTAPEAVAAAYEAQRALLKEDFAAVGDMKVRMAVHVGNADERGGDYFGPTVNRVSRLLSIGYGGQILISAATADLAQGELPPHLSLRDLGSHRLKDLAQPEQVYQLIAPELQQKFFPLRSLDTLPNNLPLQLTHLIGRENDLAEITELLGKTRLLTLVGAGGIGKTRLALQAGAEVLDRYADGVWVADFGTISDPDLIVEAVAQVFAVTPQPGRPLAETIAAALRSKSLLLILDNCEHVIGAAASMAETLLRGCSHLHIIATSREPLDIAGEMVHRVPSLAFPEALPSLTCGEALNYGAIALFAERASLANTRFALTDSSARIIADICRRLDGIPLAIELAAARVKSLSVEQLATMLHERFRLLTGGSRSSLPRQQTLRAMMDWSYELLVQDERTVFRRLGVFAGSFSLDAAQGVCTDLVISDWDVIDLLSSLVEKSLVMAETVDEHQRYRLLESTRAYALERLAADNDEERMREQHARWFLRWAEQHDAVRNSISWRVWIAQILVEIDNVRAALDWWLTGNRDVAAAAKLIALLADGLRRQEAELWRWCDVTVTALGLDASAELLAPLLLFMGSISSNLGYGRERRTALLSRGLELARSGHNERTLAHGLITLSFHLYIQGRIEEALATARDAQEHAEASGDRRIRAQTLMREGMAVFQSDCAQGRKLLDEATALFSACDDLQGNCTAALNGAELEFNTARDVPAALRAGERAIEFARALKAWDNLVMALSNAAAYHIALQEFDQARACAHESLEVARGARSWQTAAFAVQHLAAVALHDGDLRTAARLIGWCDARLKAIDEIRQETEQQEYDPLMSELRCALTPEQFAAFIAEGSMLTDDAAYDTALRV